MRDGKSQFPIYHDLGARIYQMPLSWADTATSRPARPRDPADAAYTWPTDIDYAVREARQYGMRVSLMVLSTPKWANGRDDPRWVPRRASDYGRFMAAASKRYPRVKHWMVWGEPTNRNNFRPLPRSRRRGPRAYAKILESAYRNLKSVRRSNRVIGGNTYTTGAVSPRQWIRWMKLPNGRRPRMDLYGHNPFTARKPNLKNPPSGNGYADFSDLGRLAKWIDRYFGRRRGSGIKLFLSEWTVPTDHPNDAFNFYVTRRTQAEFLRVALRITRRWSRIYSLGWLSLYDQPHVNGQHGGEVHWGLIDDLGRKKPSYSVFKRG